MSLVTQVKYPIYCMWCLKLDEVRRVVGESEVLGSGGICPHHAQLLEDEDRYARLCGEGKGYEG